MTRWSLALRPRSQYHTVAEAHVELERRGSGADTRALNFGSGRGARRTDCSVTCAWRLDGQTLFIGSLALYFTVSLGSDVGPKSESARFHGNDVVNHLSSDALETKYDESRTDLAPRRACAPQAFIVCV